VTTSQLSQLSQLVVEVRLTVVDCDQEVLAAEVPHQPMTVRMYMYCM
jgi:hypothetical protein